MAILNKDALYLASIDYMSIRDWNDCDYWYVAAEINTPLDVPNHIVNSNVTIAVCTESEAHISVVDSIYSDLVVKLDIDPARILLISENADLEPLINSVANLYNKELISYEWSIVCEKIIADETKRELLKLVNRQSYSTPSSKTFLNFNRRWRPHRLVFVALLCATKLLDKGLVSLGKDDAERNNTWVERFDDTCNLVKSDTELYDLLTKHKNEIVSLPEMYLDTTDLRSNRFRMRYKDLDRTSTDSLYDATYFSIVSETYFFEDVGRFLTEKTFKAISYKHPFILITAHRSLELLRGLGYKTFHPFIDESYDLEPDNIKRMKLILKEVDRLSNLTPDEVTLFLKNIEPITKHNFNNLVTKKKNIHKKM